MVGVEGGTSGVDEEQMSTAPGKDNGMAQVEEQYATRTDLERLETRLLKAQAASERSLLQVIEAQGEPIARLDAKVNRPFDTMEEGQKMLAVGIAATLGRVADKDDPTAGALLNALIRYFDIDIRPET